MTVRPIASGGWNAVECTTMVFLHVLAMPVKGLESGVGRERIDAARVTLHKLLEQAICNQHELSGLETAEEHGSNTDHRCAKCGSKRGITFSLMCCSASRRNGPANLLLCLNANSRENVGSKPMEPMVSITSSPWRKAP